MSKPTFNSVLRAIVNAQRCSDAGKGIYVIPASDSSSRHCVKNKYRDKSFWILSAIRQIQVSSYADVRIRFYVETDPKNPSGDGVIVYFLIQEVNEKGKRSASKQVSFHVPYFYENAAALSKVRNYIYATPRIRWNKRVGESRKNCLYFANEYGV